MRIAENPLLPCHECEADERFMAMKRSDDWTMEYLDDGSGQWVAYCPECSVNSAIEHQEGRSMSERRPRCPCCSAEKGTPSHQLAPGQAKCPDDDCAVISWDTTVSRTIPGSIYPEEVDDVE